MQRKVTYKNLHTWYTELREFRPEIPCIVVANKIDGGAPPHLGVGSSQGPYHHHSLLWLLPQIQPWGACITPLPVGCQLGQLPSS